MKTNVTCYFFYIKGLFGRNRKVKTESFYIKKHTTEKIDLETLNKLMSDMLRNTVKPKGEFQVKLMERVGTLENDNGIEIYSTNLIGGQKTLLLENRIGK
jgi:hypothetical protein